MAESRLSECHERTAVADRCTPGMSAERCARIGQHPLKTAENKASCGCCVFATRPKVTVDDRATTQKLPDFYGIYGGPGAIRTRNLYLRSNVTDGISLQIGLRIGAYRSLLVAA